MQAMNTIIYQSNMRSQDPVGGCHRLIKELERQIEIESAELELVMRQLTLCRAGAQATDSDVSTAAPNVDMNMIVGVNYDMDHYDAQNPIVIVPEQQHYLNYLFDEAAEDDEGSLEGDDRKISPEPRAHRRRWRSVTREIEIQREIFLGNFLGKEVVADGYFLKNSLFIQ